MDHLSRVVPVALCIVTLSACGSGSGSGGAAAPTDASKTAQPSTSSSKSVRPVARTADSIAADIKAAVPQVTKTVRITEDNDPNDAIGRPNQYTDAVSIYDSRAKCDSELDVTCGAKIEVWPSASDAKARVKYIQGILKDAPVLGSEYDYTSGGLLLRVSGKIKPSEVKAYESAITG